MRHLAVFLLFTSLLSFPIQAQDKDTNHCQDTKSWQEWDEHVKISPGDQEFQMLHALRLGLCLKVERGDLSLDDATAIFERARNTLIQKRKERQQGSHPSPTL